MHGQREAELIGASFCVSGPPVLAEPTFISEELSSVSDVAQDVQGSRNFPVAIVLLSNGRTC
jgi:hypothetical protein